jgi:FlaA1/EpsC-like NDP-sugar epimerase
MLRNSRDAMLSLTDASVAGLRRLAHLPRPARRGLAAVLDLVLCVVAIWLSFSLRLGSWDLYSEAVLIVTAVALPSWFLSALFCSTYRTIIRSTGHRTIIDLGRAALLFAMPMITIFLFIGVREVPRTIGLLVPIVFLMFLATSRLVIRYLVVDVLSNGAAIQRRVMIYGAGRAGQQLGQVLHHEPNLVLVGYFDDDPRLIGQEIDGGRIYSAQNLAEITERLEVEEIILALPSVSRQRRAQIIDNMHGLGVKVRSLPSFGDLIDGKVSVSDLRDIQVEDLLGRSEVAADEELLESTIKGRVVLVTGAGGSIGSELCRQVIARRPIRLVLVELSELALYKIDAELRALAPFTDIVAELGDVADKGTAHRFMQRYLPDTVFHAAAYKHVPLVEANPLSGLRNNVFGTLNCCLAASEAGVDRMVLVSTDKAVRPTNVMGASKRICELILQARADASSKPIYSIVRFGNVLGSSGSVVPKFREQIARGGPVTVTHRDVTRYFMTIPEAAQLVMQAGSMAKGGEVFLLDMNLPVKIIDLARTMIKLSGLTVRDEDNPNGDIAIEEVGLRPGEKMFEELLLSDNPEPTAHPSIRRANEALWVWNDLQAELGVLKSFLDEGDAPGALAVVRRLVPDYRPRDDEPGAGPETGRIAPRGAVNVEAGAPRGAAGRVASRA